MAESFAGKLVVEVCNAIDLMPKDGQGTASAYAVVDFDGQRRRTKTQSRDLNPQWDEVLQFSIRDMESLASQVLEINLYNDKKMGKRGSFLGKVKIAGSGFAKLGSETLVYYPLEKRSVFSQVKGEIGLKVYYVNVDPPAAAAEEQKEPEAEGEKPPDGEAKVAEEANGEKAVEEEKPKEEEKKEEEKPSPPAEDAKPEEPPAKLPAKLPAYAKLMIVTHTVKTRTCADDKEWDQVFAFDEEGLNSTNLEASIWVEEKKENEEAAVEKCLGSVSFDLLEIPKRVPPDGGVAVGFRWDDTRDSSEPKLWYLRLTVIQTQDSQLGSGLEPKVKSSSLRPELYVKDEPNFGRAHIVWLGESFVE
ncbi:hypothetical protein MLD38_015883 [Melastoma candidum]|uniref:Uncharacterized protein n=1 Tax=Melastoma candidum TaxID=119954 RepID=A0ACB9RHM2_9MYRT|nr:hypothetical protein MLD38_015883 [Melastoma candidum]